MQRLLLCKKKTWGLYYFHMQQLIKWTLHLLLLHQESQHFPRCLWNICMLLFGFLWKYKCGSMNHVKGKYPDIWGEVQHVCLEATNQPEMFGHVCSQTGSARLQQRLVIFFLNILIIYRDLPFSQKENDLDLLMLAALLWSNLSHLQIGELSAREVLRPWPPQALRVHERMWPDNSAWGKVF